MSWLAPSLPASGPSSSAFADVGSERLRERARILHADSPRIMREPIRRGIVRASLLAGNGRQSRSPFDPQRPRYGSSVLGPFPSGTSESRSFQISDNDVASRTGRLLSFRRRDKSSSRKIVPHPTFVESPVVVNIPEYRVRAYDDQLRVVLSMPVIVGGSAGRKSPALQANMTEVVFHPYWNVPAKIQAHEIASHLSRYQITWPPTGSSCWMNMAP